MDFALSDSLLDSPSYDERVVAHLASCKKRKRGGATTTPELETLAVTPAPAPTPTCFGGGRDISNDGILSSGYVVNHWM